MDFKRLYLWLVLFYFFFISFEWFILSFIKDHTLVYTIRNAIDFIPLLFYTIYFCFKCRQINAIHFNVIISIVISTLLLFVSHLIDNTSLKTIVPYLGVMFRFIPFFLLSDLFDKKAYTRIIQSAKAIYFIHILLALFEIVNKKYFLKIFLPSPSFFTEALPTVYRDSGISTTFINTVEFSFFIIILTCLLVYHYRSSIVHKWTIFFISFLLILFSFSIASILIMLVVGGLLLERKNNYNLYVVSGCLGLFIFGNLVISIFTDVDSIIDYIIISKDYNRIGYFTNLLPQFFSSNIKDIFLGIGVDPKMVDVKLYQYDNLPKMLTFGNNNVLLLKDVYWISILLMQGVFGFGVLVVTFIGVYKRAKSMLMRINFRFFNIILIVILVGGLFNQVLDLKGFAFVFWLFIGLLISNYGNETVKDFGYRP